MSDNTIAPTREELATALAAVVNCEGGRPCMECPWENYYHRSGDDYWQCFHRRARYVEHAREAGLVGEE